MEFETYRQPPIQEAILDIYAKLPTTTDLARLGEFGKTIEVEFPEQRPRFNFSGNVQFNLEDASQNQTKVATNQAGWIFRTPTKDKAVQARLDGFTFNRLPVYEGWGKFVEQARNLWDVYVKCAEVTMVTSIGLRYLNRLKLPLPLGDFQEYCVLFPKSAPHHPRALNEFLLRYGGAAQHAKGAVTIVTVTFEPPDSKNQLLPVLIDIQVTHSFVAPTAGNDTALWDAFELLRHEKNLVFENSITEKARNLFRK